MAQYGKPEYWDDRYARDPEPFDWYQRWAGLKDIIKPCLQTDAQILNIGCGNSRLSEEMYEEGYKSITNIDISDVVIKNMKEKYSTEKPEMQWRCMDARKMDALPGELFNVVVDKGSLDSILCGEGSTHNAQKALTEISRVLHKNGVYLCVSHGQPTYRLTYLERPEFGWKVTVQTVQKPMMGMTASTGTGQSDEKDAMHYIYTCQKGQEA